MGKEREGCHLLHCRTLGDLRDLSTMSEKTCLSPQQMWNKQVLQLGFFLRLEKWLSFPYLRSPPPPLIISFRKQVLLLEAHTQTVYTTERL